MVVSTLALLATCLRDPIALTLRATIMEVLREELGRYETVSAADTKWEKHQDSVNEILKRCENDFASIRTSIIATESNQKMQIEAGNRLLSIETKLELLMKEYQRDKASQGRNTRP